MTEASVRAALVKKLRQYKDWTVFRHEDHYTSGIPDISVTGNKITSWWECKLWRNEAEPTKEIQRYTLERLAVHGHAYFIVYRLKDPARVEIYRPSDYPHYPWIRTEGFNHDWIVAVIRETHGYDGIFRTQ